MFDGLVFKRIQNFKILALSDILVNCPYIFIFQRERRKASNLRSGVLFSEERGSAATLSCSSEKKKTTPDPRLESERSERQRGAPGGWGRCINAPALRAAPPRSPTIEEKNTTR